MANTITSKLLLDGIKNVIVKIDIQGDGVSGEAEEQVVYDSTLSNSNNTKLIKIKAITAALNDFSARLFWGGDDNEFILDIPPNLIKKLDFCDIGGINNSDAINQTGQILLSTNGLAAGVTSSGYIILEIQKR